MNVQDILDSALAGESITEAIIDNIELEHDEDRQFDIAVSQLHTALDADAYIHSLLKNGTFPENEDFKEKLKSAKEWVKNFIVSLGKWIKKKFTRLFGYAERLAKECKERIELAEQGKVKTTTVRPFKNKEVMWMLNGRGPEDNISIATESMSYAVSKNVHNSFFEIADKLVNDESIYSGDSEGVTKYLETALAQEVTIANQVGLSGNLIELKIDGLKVTKGRHKNLINFRPGKRVNIGSINDPETIIIGCKALHKGALALAAFYRNNKVANSFEKILSDLASNEEQAHAKEKIRAVTSLLAAYKVITDAIYMNAIKTGRYTTTCLGKIRIDEYSD